MLTELSLLSRKENEKNITEQEAKGEKPLECIADGAAGEYCALWVVRWGEEREYRCVTGLHTAVLLIETLREKKENCQPRGREGDTVSVN